jgi:ABC-2 type transport system permease protein
VGPGDRRCAEAGGALVFATQNMEEVERVADRVAALRDGRLVFTGGNRRVRPHADRHSFRMKRTLLLLRKDALVLRRSPLLLGILLAYPLAIAILVGLVASYASAKPRVALVDEDNLPPTVVIGGHRFHVDRTIEQVSKNVKLVHLSSEQAAQQLKTGKVVAVVTVPPGFIATLRRWCGGPKLEVELSQGTISSRVEQQVQALVYSLNRQLQRAYIEHNLRYVSLILKGGDKQLPRAAHRRARDREGGEAARRDAGHAPERAAARVPARRAPRARQTRATHSARPRPHPIELVRAPVRGRTWILSAEVQAYALGLTITFLALMLAAGVARGRARRERDRSPRTRAGRSSAT